MAGRREDMAARVVLRPARMEDYTEVLALGYGGQDYLPAKYHHFLKDPNRYLQVMVVDGKVIGFAMAYIIDDGQTLVGQAVRIHADYRKLGIWGKMRIATSTDGNLQKEPTYITTIFADWHANKTVPFHRLLMKRHQLKCQVIHPSSDKKSSVIPGNSRGLPVRITKETSLSLFLSDKDNQWKLFPHGIVITNWTPFKLMKSNHKLIWEGTHAIFTMHDASGSEVVSASFREGSHCQEGLVYSLYYYGADFKHLLGHIDEHLKVASGLHVEKELFMNIYLPNTMDVRAAKDHIAAIPAIRVAEISSVYVGKYPFNVGEMMARIKAKV